MKFFYSVSLLLLSFFGFSQKEANIWYFGDHAGVDFNSGSPVALTDGVINTIEGCASIADKFGNILFYTDGKSVYNKLNTLMPNGAGLMGDKSSTQSAIIVPKPGSATIYYIFTVASMSGVNGLRYSIVDITLDGGKGDVITKNILLVTPVDEKLTTILHRNKKDIWVIALAATSNTYYSYLVKSSGIAPVVVSVAGAAKSSSVFGYLKASSNGNYLVDGRYTTGKVNVLKFSKTTGIVNSWFGFNSSSCYGVEFSPDDSKLYVSDNAAKNIYQLDMSSGVPSTIISSRSNVATSLVGFAAMQIGPDKKLYIARFPSSYLACIPNPNALGIGCGFIDTAVNLAGKVCNAGLPHVQTFLSAPPFTYTNNCKENPTAFFIQDSASLTSVIWNFGDIASGVSNSSTFFGPKHSFSSEGTYTVQAIVTSTCCSDDTLTDVITISKKPNINLGNDTTICEGSPLNLSIPDTSFNYLWHNGTTTFYTTISTAGAYWVKVTNECGFATDTIRISTIYKPSFVLNNDTSICDGMSLDLKVTNSSSVNNYVWSNATIGNSINVSNAGKYWATATNQCGSYSDTVEIALIYKPVISLREDTVICDGTLELKVANTNANYLWQNGNTNSSITVDEVGTYWLRASNQCGSATDTVRIKPCGVITIPNVITINGDGVNDVFKIKNLELGVAELKILNRWGNLIYESKGYNNDWSPKDLNDGVYYFMLNYPPDKKEYTGFINVFGAK